MTTDRKPEYLVSLVHELCKLPQETEWGGVQGEPKRTLRKSVSIFLRLPIRQHSAAKRLPTCCGASKTLRTRLLAQPSRPPESKPGMKSLKNRLLRLLSPKIPFRFFEIVVDAHNVVLLEIGGLSYIRCNSRIRSLFELGLTRKKLKDFSEKERELWRIFDQTPFEDLIAAEEVGSQHVLMLLDYPTYFSLLKLPLPETRDGILQALSADDLIRRTESGRWNITNLGAILLAKKLEDFRSLRRKAVRVIAYKGNSRVETLREQDGTKGYASGFEGLIGYINLLLPSNEVIGKALRTTVPMYPDLAIPELVANALIHQDFFITGAGPMIEIFADRMEICNPGEPLVDTQRFLDTPPRSRNEALASFMRRVGVCEERGSGVDKVVIQTELYQLPAPDFEAPGDNTRAILFAHRPLVKMAKNRPDSVLLPACLSALCDAGPHDQHLAPRALRDRNP